MLLAARALAYLAVMLFRQFERAPQAGIVVRGECGADGEGLFAEFAVVDDVVEAKFGVFGGVEAGQGGGWQERIELIPGFDLPRDDFEYVALDGFGGFSGAIDGELACEGFVELF